MLPNPINYHIYTGQPLPLPWPYAYVLASQGVFKLVDTPHFYASLKVSNGRPIAGLRRWPEGGLRLKVPRVPAGWLRAVLEHTRHCGDMEAVARPVEQMYHFHFFGGPVFAGQWRMMGNWRVSVPRQRASAGQVVYRGGDEPTVVLDLHSHHEMPAYFSQADNRDELGCRFYAVIGRIYSRPEIRLRLGVFGDFVELEPGVLFEGLGEFNAADY